MATSTTAIANLALSHLGVAKTIGNLDTESSSEATACRTFYEECRNIVLRDFEWPFATRYVDLGLVAENPNTEWEFSYRFPSDAEKFRKILSGVRNETNESRVPYILASDDIGKLIYTDQSNATGKYTKKITDVSLFPSDFTMALSLRLAYYIAPRVTRGDPFKLQEKVINNYFIEISRTKATALNEEQSEKEPESEFIRSRGGYVDGYEAICSRR
jgi:hypothetical protein